MHTLNLPNRSRLLAFATSTLLTAAGTGCLPYAAPGDGNGNGSGGGGDNANNAPPTLQIGADNNNTTNAFVQPQDPALAGGGRDQSLQNGDVLFGTDGTDVQIGRLGQDTMLGGYGDDVQIGGTEHFNPNNRDRAFGQYGNDVFIWQPGDGSDFYDGGPGIDVLIFGLVGERNGDEVTFGVTNDQQAGDVFIDPETGLPQVDVTNSPGFCEVLDASTSADAAAALAELDLDALVRFSIRGIRDAFEAGERDDDNGLRVTIHTRNVEFVVCTTRDGGAIEVLDLRTSPPTVVSLEDVTTLVPNVAAMAF